MKFSEMLAQITEKGRALVCPYLFFTWMFIYIDLVCTCFPVDESLLLILVKMKCFIFKHIFPSSQ